MERENTDLVQEEAATQKGIARNKILDEGQDASVAIWKKLSGIVRSPYHTPTLWVSTIPLTAMALLVSLAVSGINLGILPIIILLLASVRIVKLCAEDGYEQDANSLAPYDMRWVGALAQALQSPHPRIRGVARKLLTHLLPHLTVETAYLLTNAQRSYLNQCLIKNKAAEFQLNRAILIAWGRMGALESIAIVEALAISRPTSTAKRVVRDAAKECLLQLEAHQERQRLQEETQHLSPEQVVSQVQQIELSIATRAAIAEADAQLEKLRAERRKHSNPGMRMAYLVASWLVIVPYCAWQTWYSFRIAESLGWTVLWALVTLAATQFHRLSLSSRQTEAAVRLADTEDIRAVGPLAEALEWPDAVVQHVAASALTRLLPRLTASNGNLLDAKQRSSLYNILRMSNVHANYPLIKATLKALQQVGDLAAIPVVERLTTAYTYTERQREIKQLALDTMPLLTLSAQNQGVSSQLLRASAATDLSMNLLLRSAMANSDEEPDELLRSTEGLDSVCPALVTGQVSHPLKERSKETSEKERSEKERSEKVRSEKVRSEKERSEKVRSEETPHISVISPVLSSLYTKNAQKEPLPQRVQLGTTSEAESL